MNDGVLYSPFAALRTFPRRVPIHCWVPFSLFSKLGSNRQPLIRQSNLLTSRPRYLFSLVTRDYSLLNLKMRQSSQNTDQLFRVPTIYLASLETICVLVRDSIQKLFVIRRKEEKKKNICYHLEVSIHIVHIRVCYGWN